MPIISTFVRLFHDLSVYRMIVSQKLKTSFTLFLLFYLLYSLVTSIVISNRVAPQISATLSAIKRTASEQIPNEATIVIANGQLITSGIVTPVVVPLPDSLKTQTIMNLLYVDPQAETSGLASSSALIGLGKQAVRLAAPYTSSADVVSYSDGGFTMNYTGSTLKQNFDMFIQDFDRIKPYLPWFITLPLLIGFLVARLLHAAIYAFLFSIGSTLFDRKYSFREFLNLTLHTILVADTINGIIWLLYGQSYSLVFSLVFLGLSLLAYFNLPKTETSV